MKSYLNETVIDIAIELGFDLVGFSKAVPLEIEHSRLMDWLHQGKHAGMTYMERNTEKRLNVREIFPEAKSVISLGMNYYTPFEHTNEPGLGKISRYALGKDYHLVIWEKLDEFISRIKEIDNSFSAISYVDTGPVMDKAWAVRGGLGWMGKNTNIINPEKGSWFFIATVITNTEFEYSEILTDHCGTCTACLDACPTDALSTAYSVDANACISYLTIENKGEIPEAFRGKMENWLFGCDICQDVCPWNNKFAEETRIHEFYSDIGKTSLSLDEVIAMSKEEFAATFAQSPIQRTKLKGLQRNALFLKQ